MIKKVAFEIVKAFVVVKAFSVGERIVELVKNDISYRNELENYRAYLVDKFNEIISGRGMADRYEVESEIKDSFIIMKVNPKNA